MLKILSKLFPTKTQIVVIKEKLFVVRLNISKDEHLIILKAPNQATAVQRATKPYESFFNVRVEEVKGVIRLVDKSQKLKYTTL